jgi:tetratricopeptide (TPR) repeat protein
VAEHTRIEELRRRLQHDPTSIAFAQLAEALRREGRVQEAVDTCRAGLSYHPDYLSAHVTLGRALVETGDLETAKEELTDVLTAAPDNLAAMKGLADIHQRRGELREALQQYRGALSLAPHDPDLEQAVSRLAASLGPPSSPPGLGSLPDGPAGTPTSAADSQSAGLEGALATESPAPVAGTAPQGSVEAEGPPASGQLEALERWLDAILSDRERQS